MGKLPPMRRRRFIRFKRFFFKFKNDGVENIRQNFKGILGLFCGYVQVTDNREQITKPKNFVICYLKCRIRRKSYERFR